MQQLNDTGIYLLAPQRLFCFLNKDAGMKAELIWAMKTVGSYYSCTSCYDLKVPELFIVSSYLQSETTGPYFKNYHLLHSMMRQLTVS